MDWVAKDKERLDKFLLDRITGVSRAKLSQHIQSGKVKVDGLVVIKPGLFLKPGMVVETGEVENTNPHTYEPIHMELNVKFEDEHLLVVNKARGLAVHPANSLTGATLVHGLLARGHGLSEIGGAFRPGIVHRLDKETTGLLVIAKSDAVHSNLSEQIQQRLIQRRYVAVINGELPNPRFTIDAPLGRNPRNPLLRAVVPLGKPARTHIRSLKQLDQGLLISCRLESGRTHQIRVHLSHFGWPVLGDDLYAPPKLQDGPLQLHAASLEFTHPITNRIVKVFAEPPQDFFGANKVIQEEVTSWE